MAQIFRNWQAAYPERGLPTFPINQTPHAVSRRCVNTMDTTMDCSTSCGAMAIVCQRTSKPSPTSPASRMRCAQKLMDDDEVVAVATSVLKTRMNVTLGSGGGVCSARGARSGAEGC